MYTLHITRQTFWAEPDTTKYIPEAEWLAVKPEVPETFNYRYGNINVDGPDDQTIQLMKHVAQKLNATVQGDDGEKY